MDRIEAQGGYISQDDTYISLYVIRENDSYGDFEYHVEYHGGIDTGIPKTTDYESIINNAHERFGYENSYVMVPISYHKCCVCGDETDAVIGNGYIRPTCSIDCQITAEDEDIRI